MKLWVRIAWASTFLVMMTVIAVGGLLFWAEKRQLLSSHLARQKESIGRFVQVCVESSAGQNDLMLINYVRSLFRVPGFKYAYFYDNEGKFRAHSDPAQIGFAAPDFARNEFRGGIDEVIFPVNYQAVKKYNKKGNLIVNGGSSQKQKEIDSSDEEDEINY